MSHKNSSQLTIIDPTGIELNTGPPSAVAVITSPTFEVGFKYCNLVYGLRVSSSTTLSAVVKMTSSAGDVFIDFTNTVGEDGEDVIANGYIIPVESGSILTLLVNVVDNVTVSSGCITWRFI